MWLLPIFASLMFVLVLSLSVQFTLASYCFLFYPYLLSFCIYSPPLAFSTPFSWVSPKLFALLAPCPIRALSCTRGCVLRECQLHLAESKLEAASSGGSEWRVGRLYAEIPESLWGRRRRSGPGSEGASYPGPTGADSVRGAGEMELVQRYRGSLHCRGDWTQQPGCDLQN